MGTAAIGLRKIAPADHRRMAWKNGLGTTEEIAIDPPDSDLVAGRFNWRLSIATVGQSCRFSAFPGYERTIMVIEGAGMELDLSGQPTQRLDRAFDPFVFSGDDPAECRLIAGPVRDFNLMTDCARWRSQTAVLQVRPAQQSLDVVGDIVIVHSFDETIDVAIEALAASEHLPATHTLVIGPGMARPLSLRLMARRAGTVALISLQPR